MDTVWLVAVCVAFVGAPGFAAGRLIGACIARWARRPERSARIAVIAVALLLAGIGVQQASAVRTVPKNAADARAHDYSLAAMWQAVVLWTFGVNAAGAWVGIRRAVRTRRAPAPEGSYADERT